jgi:hypothetical protein
MPQWVAREFLARRGNADFTPSQVKPARCPLLGYALRTITFEGQTVAPVFLRVEMQPEVGEQGYEAGAKVLANFFHEQVKSFLEPDLLPLGRQIIECCLNNGSLEDYERLIPHRVVSPE